MDQQGQSIGQFALRTAAMNAPQMMRTQNNPKAGLQALQNASLTGTMMGLANNKRIEQPGNNVDPYKMRRPNTGQSALQSAALTGTMMGLANNRGQQQDNNNMGQFAIQNLNVGRQALQNAAITATLADKMTGIVNKNRDQQQQNYNNIQFGLNNQSIGQQALGNSALTGTMMGLVNNRNQRQQDNINVGQFAMRTAALNAPAMMIATNNKGARSPSTNRNIGQYALRTVFNAAPQMMNGNQSAISNNRNDNMRPKSASGMGPKIVAFNNRPISPQPGYRISNVPVHQSVYINVPNSHQSSVRGQDYRINLNRPSNLTRKHVISPLEPGQPEYQQLVSPQQIDYFGHPQRVDYFGHHQQQVISIRENNDGFVTSTPEYQSPIQVHSRAQRQQIYPPPVKMQVVSEPQYYPQPQRPNPIPIIKKSKSKNKFNPMLLACLLCMSLTAVILGVILAFNLFGRSSGVASNLPTLPQFNITKPKIPQLNITKPEIPLQETRNRTIQASENVDDSSNETANGTQENATETTTGNTTVIIEQDHFPHTVPGLPPPSARQPLTEPGLQPKTSYMFPESRFQRTPTSMKNAIHKPLTEAQVPDIGQDTEFQYPPGTTLFDTQYMTSQRQTHSVNPLPSHQFYKPASKLHRLRIHSAN